MMGNHLEYLKQAIDFYAEQDSVNEIDPMKKYNRLIEIEKIIKEKINDAAAILPDNLETPVNWPPPGA